MNQLIEFLLFRLFGTTIFFSTYKWHFNWHYLASSSRSFSSWSTSTIVTHSAVSEVSISSGPTSSSRAVISVFWRHKIKCEKFGRTGGVKHLFPLFHYFYYHRFILPYHFQHFLSFLSQYQNFWIRFRSWTLSLYIEAIAFFQSRSEKLRVSNFIRTSYQLTHS